MQKFFTLAEAESLLPAVGRALAEARDLQVEYLSTGAELDRLSQRIMLEGGVRVDREHIIDTRARRDASAQRLKETIEQIHSYGCQVKDLDIGLVDFPTWFHGQEVLLCWKLGEEAIEFWHGTDEGFRGRKRIDQEFLKHHSATRRK